MTNGLQKQTDQIPNSQNQTDESRESNDDIFGFGDKEPTDDNGERLETQAERIIKKFGGARDLMRALFKIGKPRNPVSIYKWTYSREGGGTGGLIPTSALSDVLAAAKLEGIIISSEDMDPRAFPVKILNESRPNWRLQQKQKELEEQKQREQFLKDSGGGK